MTLSQLEQDLSMIKKEVPSNITAEQILLGAILLNNEELQRVSDFLVPDHFYQAVHKRIYTGILTTLDKGLIATPVSLKHFFDKDKDLEKIGGGEYLSYLVSLNTNIINVHDYGRIIYDLAIKRQLINIGEDIVNDAYINDLNRDAFLQLEEAESKLFDLASQGGSNNTGFQPLSKSIIASIDRTKNAFLNKNSVTGITTGLTDLDKLLGGLHNSDLLILAGRPSMGKTAFAISLAISAATSLFEKHKNDKVIPSIGFFSLEMSSDQLAGRMLSMYTELDMSAMRTGFIKDSDMSKVIESSKLLNRLPLFIDDTPALTISALRTRARRLKRKHNLAILFIDYLQLIRSTSSKGDNRVNEITEITQGLKAIAKELDIPVIALSQLSRAVEQREDKRPLLSDLRESGSIEQDADIVMFIYRDEYYESRKEPEAGTDKYAKWLERMKKIQNIADIIIAKHRNGPIGYVPLFFEARYNKFCNLSKS